MNIWQFIAAHPLLTLAILIMLPSVKIRWGKCECGAKR